MTVSLTGTIALVTGAGGGIGGATCAALLEAGAHVIATDLASTPASRPSLRASLEQGAKRRLETSVLAASHERPSAEVVMNETAVHMAIRN